jgi:hypothetical protein
MDADRGRREGFNLITEKIHPGHEVLQAAIIAGPYPTGQESIADRRAGGSNQLWLQF